MIDFFALIMCGVLAFGALAFVGVIVLIVAVVRSDNHAQRGRDGER